MSEPPRILHLPHYDRNPYQELLLKEFKSVNGRLTKGYPLDIVINIIKFRPDILHFHWVSDYIVHTNRGVMFIKAFSFIAFCSLLKLLGINIVWTAHNVRNHESINVQYEIFFKSLFCQCIDSVIVHCEAAKEPVNEKLEVSREDMVVIPHGNYSSYYCNNLSKVSARNDIGINQDAIVFGFFGQIREYKRVPDLIESFAKLKSEQSILLVAGNPINQQMKEEIQTKASQVSGVETYLQFIPDSEVHKYFQASDYMVYPFTDVLTSGSAILAMSFAKPIIAPKEGCIPDLLSLQKELLINGDSIEIELLDKFKLAMELDGGTVGKANQERIERFTWDRAAEETEAVYEKILS